MNKEVIDILKKGLKEAINEDCTIKIKIEGCKALLDYINQLETNRDDAIEFIDIYTDGINLEAFDCLDLMYKIKEILKRGKEY
jgi:hypothetical protein